MSDPARAVRPREPHRRVWGARFLASAAAVSTLFLGMGGPAAAPASAAAEGPPAAFAITAVGAVTAPIDGAFVGGNSLTVRGTMAAGSTVAVVVSMGAGCASAYIDTARDTWSCEATLLNGPDVVITAVETRPDNRAQESKVTVDVLGPPTIEGPTLTPGSISGSGYPGAAITLAVGATAQLCPATVNQEGYWSCVIAADSGAYAVTATQSHPDLGTPPGISAKSISSTVTVDKSQPAAPTITSPRAGQRIASQPFTVEGTGESGGRVDVYVDGVPRCSATVPSSRWSCSVGGFTSGSNTIQAVLRDAAGNYAVGNSAPIRVQFGPAPTSPAEPDHDEPQEPTPTPTPTPTPDTPALPWAERPIFPGPNGHGPTIGEALTNWGSPTEFGSDLPSPAETAAMGSWGWAPLLAIGFVGFVAVPLRMLASSLRGRIRMPRANLTGRNRVVPKEDAAPRNPWLLGAVPLAVTAMIIVFAEGMNGEVRYLRLIFAVGLGLAVLNIVGVAITTRLSSGRLGVGGRLRFQLILLLAAASSALLSRWTGIEPPVVSGILIGAGFALAVPARPRAMVNLAQVGAILGLAVLGWLGHSLVGEVVGFWPSVLSETLATICLAGLGSALVLMLPLGPLPGRVILEWSARVWLASILVVSTVAGAIIIGGTGTQFPLLAAALIGAGFAAVCVAVWAWVRYVETVPS